MKQQKNTQTKAKNERFSRTLNSLGSFLNCVRGKHDWQRRQINFELDGQIVASQLGYGCSRCSAYVRDCDLKKDERPG
jgi:hypothetical protein